MKKSNESLFKGLKLQVSRASDHLLMRLTELSVVKGSYAQMNEAELLQLCKSVTVVLSEDASCISVASDVSWHVVGDLYGEYNGLLHILSHFGYPPYRRYIFLGNYVNRGAYSIETIAMLYALKTRYPRQVILLRGNHECRLITKHYGLKDDCLKRYSIALWSALVATFDMLPCAATIDDRIFLTHSGLSPLLSFRAADDRSTPRDPVNENVHRPTDVMSNSIVNDLLWSEPDSHCTYWVQHPKGQGYLFSAEVVREFCERFKLDLIIRSNETLHNGYELFADNLMLTFSTLAKSKEGFRNKTLILNLEQNQKADEQVYFCHLIEMKDPENGKSNNAASKIFQELPNSPLVIQSFAKRNRIAGSLEDTFNPP